MPKTARELTALEVQTLVEPGRYAVGGVSGLLLQVRPNGSKSWILRAKIGNKRRDIGLGPFPRVTLKKAREEAQRQRETINQGIDPIAAKKKANSSLIEQQAKDITFDQCARQAIDTKTKEFKNKKHAAQWYSTIETYASPYIGKMVVSDIQVDDIVRLLDPIWFEKTETANRVRQRVEYILNWATVRGYREGENPAQWVGKLETQFPKPGKVAKKKNQKALPVEQVGEFMDDLRKREGMGARALEFAILTATRSGEVRGAVWDEIDLERGIWTIPAERMKAGKEHRVPLSKDAVSLLESLPRFIGTSLVFPSTRNTPLSDNTLRTVMVRMEVDAVPHGFRSTFSDWCSEYTNYARQISEMALAHTIKNAVEAAYNRSDLLEKRRRLMEDWARFCNTKLSKGEVIKINQSN